MFRAVMLLFFIGLSTTAFALLNDPTCPPGQSPHISGASVGDLSVQSIFVSPNRKMVVIGGRQLTVGDKIIGAEIVSIDAHTVTLQGKRGKFIIEIFQPINKKPANKKGEKT